MTQGLGVGNCLSHAESKARVKPVHIRNRREKKKKKNSRMVAFSL